MHDPLLDEKVRQAVDAIREGDREAARLLLEEILEENEDYAPAWMLLGRLSSDPEEKRMAFNMTLELNPDNAKAQELLEQLEEKVGKAPEVEIIPGVSRTLFRRILAGVGGAIALVFIIVIVSVLSSRSAENQRNEDATAEAMELTEGVARITRAVAQQTIEAENRTATQLSLTTATPTTAPTSDLPTLPPTFTPEPTEFIGRPSPAPAAEAATGRILGWSGRDLSNIDALPIVFYALGGYASPEIVTDLDGRFPTLSGDGSQIVYAGFSQQRQDFQIEIVNIDGEVPERLLSRITTEAFEDSGEPRFSPDGTRVVFTGVAIDTRTREIYILTLSGDGAGAVATRRLTVDTANYAAPSWSPDGSQIAVVKDDPESDNPGPDIFVLDADTGVPRAITNDRGETAESNPRWSPDGGLLTFSGQTDADGGADELYILASDGSSNPLKLEDASSEADDRYPVFSPDGSFLAFASDRTDGYDIFIFNLSSRELFQLTDSDDDDFPSEWVGP